MPRGFLRLYILTLLSRGPSTGYSMIQTIEEKSEGAWRPGPGTMYPLLKSLVTEGLAKGAGPAGRMGGRRYVLTAKGRRKLEEMRRTIASMGKMEKALMGLFTDVLPGDVYIQMMLSRYKRGMEIFRQKAAEVSKQEREAALSELRVFMDAQIKWIDSQLKRDHAPSRF